MCWSHSSPGLLLLLVFRNSAFHHRPEVPDQSLRTQTSESKGYLYINFAWTKATTEAVIQQYSTYSVVRQTVYNISVRQFPEETW